jgi:hypothetical protein
MKNVFTILAFILLMGIISTSVINAQSDIDKKFLKENLNYFLEANNSGTLFYMSFIPCWEEPGPNNALRIYIHCAVATKVTLEIPALGVIRSKTTAPNDVIEFVLPPSEGQCYSKGDGSLPIPPQPEQVWLGRAVIIKSEDPIICYGVTRYQYTSDGFLAYPVTSYGKSYTVSSYVDPTNNSDQFLPSETAIVGVYDNTKVTFRMGGCESCKVKKLGGDTLKYGEIIRRTLNEGDVWLLSGIGPYNDLSGSKITATKPVSVYSGNFCAYIPSHVAACDFIDEQEIPENIWGTKYHITPMINRKNFSIIKVFAKKPFTQVYLDGVPMWTISSPGGILGTGFIEARAGIDPTPRPVVISSDPGYPINVVQYNPGQNDDNILSDPFQIQCVPVEQYQREIVFNTPGIRDGFGFKENYINLVYKAKLNGGIPDDMEFAEVSNGQFHWMPLNSYAGNPGKSFAYDTPDKDNRIYYSKTIKLPYDGVFRIKGNDPFTCYAYGFSNYDSYGFPASSSMADNETPDSLSPYLEFGKDCSGNVAGSVIDEPRNDPDNRSNLSFIYIDRTLSYNYTFIYEPFVVGEDASTTWTLLINDETVNASAHLIFIDRAGNSKDTIIEHFAISPSITEYSENYGTFKLELVPIEMIHTFTLKNIGDRTIDSNQYRMYVTLDSKHFDNKPNDIKVYQNFDLVGIENVDFTPLISGQELKFNVKFTARTEGSFRDSIGVIVIDKSTGDTCVYKYFTLIEAFAGNQYIMADDYDFKQQTINKRTNAVIMQIVNPKNSIYNATADLKITGYTITGDVVGVTGSGAIFEIDGLQGISDKSPLYIAPGATYPFQVSFSPNAVRSFSSEIKFIADTDIPDNLSLLKGIGIELLPGLIVNSYDWGERLADPNSYIAKGGSYNFTPYQSANNCLKFYNDGTAPVSLSVPEISLNNNGDAFLIEVNEDLIPLSDSLTLFSVFNGMILESNEEKIFPVYFHPKTNGLHELEVIFNSNALTSPLSKLRGIGVFPKSETENLNFGNTIVGSGKVHGQVRFTNTLWTNDYDLTITNFRTEADGIASFTDIGSIGIFRWNNNTIVDKFGNPLNFPIKLKPGDFITVKGEYVPKTNGSFSARLITISDAEVEAVSTWTGTAIVEDWELTSDLVITCQNLTKTLHPKITNNGSEPLEIINWFVANDNNIPGASLNDFDISLDTPIIIKSGETLEIPIIFTPNGFYKNSVFQFKVETNSVTKPKDQTDITVTATFNKFASITKLIVKDYKERIAPGTADALKYTVQLDRNNEISESDILSFKVVISYSLDFLGLSYNDGNRTDPKIEISNEMISEGYQMLNPERKVDTSSNTETITMQFIGSESIFRKGESLDLVTITFDTYLPYYKDGEGNLVLKNKTTTISHEILTDDVCLSVLGDKCTATLDSTCVDPIRQFNYSTRAYELKQVNPNPVGSEGGEIKFSIGGKNINTEIRLFNESGKLVSTIFSAILNSGEYSIRIPIEELSSGLYFYEMTAGPFKDFKKLVVQK